MSNNLNNRDESLDERSPKRYNVSETTILEYYIIDREKERNSIISTQGKSYYFDFSGSNNLSFRLINYGIGSPRDGRPKIIVLKGELVGVKDIAGRIFISYQIKEDHISDSFFVEDVIQDARERNNRFRELVVELLVQNRKYEGEAAEAVRMEARYAHELAAEYNKVEVLFRDLQRDFFIYGENAIVKYFENGRIAQRWNVSKSVKGKKYGDLTKEVDKLLVKYNCIRHKTVPKKIRVKMVSELKTKGFESTSDATLRTTLQRKGFSIEKRLK
jgi:hypothetical protein